MGEVKMEQKKVYSEVYAVLCALGEDYKKKIPKKIFNKINVERDHDYQFHINEDKPLIEQNLSPEAIAMLAALKLDYLCESKEEKEDLELLLKANDKDIKLSSNLQKILFKSSQ